MDEKNIDLRKLGEEVAALLGWRLGSAARKARAGGRSGRGSSGTTARP